MKPTLLLPILLLMACDALLVQPGADFRVDIHSPSVISASQRIAPIEVRFSVHGCDRFEISAAERTTGGDNTITLDAIANGDGTFTTHIPMSWLTRDLQRCGHNADTPDRSYPRLSAHCLLDERRVDSDHLEIDIVTAEANVFTRGSIDHILPAQVPDEFLALGAGWMHWIGDGQSLGDVPTTTENGRQPILTRSEDRGYLWIGCPLPRCENTRWEEGDAIVLTTGSHVFGYEFEPNGLDTLFRGGNLIAPGTVVDMTLEGDTLIALSRVNDRALITRYEGEVRTVQRLTETYDITPLSTREDGTRTFATLPSSDPGTMLIHTLDGDVIQTFTLPATAGDRQLFPSPEGRQFAFLAGQQLWLGDGGIWTLLETRPNADIQGIEWTETDLAVFTHGELRVFDRRAPHAPRWTYTPLGDDGRSDPDVTGVTAADGLIIAATSSGVRILDAEGREVGGADPLACGAAPDAVAANGDTLAVGTTEGVLLFDLARYR